MTIAVVEKDIVKTVKDFEKILFNYFTGRLDLALEFNSNRIITHLYNSAGNPNVAYDPSTGKKLTAEPQTVIDNHGNVVVMGAGGGSTDYR